eukprot:5032851-Pleurochrysis_carterae.AAC.1
MSLPSAAVRLPSLPGSRLARASNNTILARAAKNAKGYVAIRRAGVPLTTSLFLVGPKACVCEKCLEG